MADETASAPAPAAPPSRNPWPRRLAKWLAAGVLGLLALLVAAYFVLDSSTGRRFVADQIEAMEFDNGMRIRVGRIEGSLYGAMTIHDLSLLDTRGEFLFAPEVAIDWRPLAWRNNHLDIRTARAQRLYLRRIPQFKPVADSDKPLLPDIDIDIGQLAIAELIAEPAVSGERRVLSLSGKAHIADGRAQVMANAAELGGGDRLALKLDAVPDANRLELDLALDAPAGGVVAALAGLSQPLALRVNGKGDWRAWDGALAADVAGAELARLTLSARDGTFAAKGPVRPAPLLNPAMARVLGGQVALDLAATPEQRRFAIAARATADNLTASANGIADLSDNTFAGMKVALAVLRPAAIAPDLQASGMRAMLTLDGAFAAPRVSYAVNAARLGVNGMTVENLVARGDARVDPDRIVIPVAARASRILGLDAVAGGQLANVRIDGDLALSGPRVVSDNLRIRSDRIDATALVVADTARGVYTGAIDGKVDRYQVAGVGLFDIDTDMRVETQAKGFALAGTLRARSRRIDNAGVRDFLGGQAAGSARVRYGPDGVVRFSALRLNAPLLRITDGSGSYSPGGAIAIDASAVSREYGPVGVRLAGTLDNPQARIVARSPGLGIGLAGLEAQVSREGAGWRLAASGATDYGPLTADVSLSQGAGMALTIHRANLGGIDFNGALRRTGAGPFAGQLVASGQGVNGIVRLGAQGRFQEALVNLRARNTVLPGPARLSVGTAIVDARVVLYAKHPHVVADAQLAAARFGAFDLSAARVLVDYRDGRGQAKALVEGSSGVPFRVAANASLEPRLWRVMLDGKARGVAFRTASPARIVPGARDYELLPTRVDFGQGNARIAGTFGQGIKLQSRLDRFDVALVNAFIPGLGLGGTATGSIDFAQPTPATFPRADARLAISGFTRTTASARSQPVDVNLVGNLMPDGGEARAVFRLRGSVVGRMVASLKPLGAGAGSWTTRLLSAPLGGGIRYNGPADALFSLTGMADQRLSGPIGVAADFSCRVSDPCLNGVVRANALTYENLTYGTRLTRMALAGRFAGNRLEIERLNAAAGNGTVTASGTITLAAAAGYPMNIAIDLDNARLARSDALSARATGKLRLEKVAGADALLSGDLVLPETRYKLVREGAAEVPALTGVRFREPAVRRVTGEEPAVASAGLFDRLRLDVGLVANDELYVSGMGLESEWTARFRVGGTTRAPVMTGNVELVRGTLGFAGRSFELTRGEVNFTGGAQTNPAVAIVATEDIDGTTVNVNVTGRAFQPQISFASVPALPQDEVLSRILFGNSIANLSAVQAVQLAASLNSLRGGSGGLNPLGRLRSATGIDRLRILGPDEATGRGTALAAGQYITDRVYVELITDARGFTATQLEVGLTPWLSVLSQAGGSGATNVNFRIKKDY